MGNSRIITPAIQRFEAKLAMVPIAGCWIWTGSVDTYGYGHIKTSGMVSRTHRFSYQHFIGSIPANKLVCHKCDVPACCNPHHLFLGSKQDNSNDCVRKGRSSRGIKRKDAKLSEANVLEIRAMQGTNRALAEKYGVSEFTISCVRRRQTWKHI